MPQASGEEDKNKDELTKAGRLGQACVQESSVKTKDGDKVLGPLAAEELVAMLSNFLARSRKQTGVDDLLKDFQRPENKEIHG